MKNEYSTKNNLLIKRRKLSMINLSIIRTKILLVNLEKKN